MGARVEFTNDMLVPLPRIEWDDHDSYGFLCEALLPSDLVLNASLHGITSRTDSAETASRMDLLTLDARKWFRTVRLGVVNLDWALGADIQALGDFGMSALQMGWHSGIGIERPVPTDYDAPFSMDAGFSTSARIFPDWLLAPFLSLDAEASLDSMAFSAATGARWGGLQAACGYLLRSGSSASTAVNSLWNARSGLFVAAQCQAGFLRYSCEAFPLSGTGNAGISAVFGREAVHTGVGLDVGAVIGSTAATSVHASALLGRGRPVALAVDAGMAGGFITRSAEGDSTPRFADYSLGVLADAPLITDWLHARLGVRAGVCFEDLRALTIQDSAVCDSRIMADGGIVGELRASLPFIRSSILGLGVRAVYSPLRLEAGASDGDYPTRPPFHVEAFVFSK
jgi:hypothetical protein